MEKYIYVPLGVRVAIPNMARGCPFTCSFCSQWKFWRDYRVRDPKKVVDEIEKLVNEHDVGFFILADEEPTINRKKFIQFCEELIARGLPDKVKWGINTRVTDIMRDKELCRSTARPGLVHVSLGTEAAAQLKLDQFNKETKVERTRRRSASCARPTSSWRRSSSSASTTRRRRRWRKPTRWRGTGSPTSPTGRCTRPGPSPRSSRSWDKVEIFDFSKIQLRHPDHEARSHGPRDAAGPGDAQLPALLHAQGAVPLSVARHRLPAALPAGLPQGLPQGRLRAHVLRPRQGTITGARNRRRRSSSTSTGRAPSPRRRWRTGFAGNARVSIAPGHPAIIEIRSNPIAVPGCPWHRGVFETLFSGILGKPVHVDHSTLFDGQSCDRFMVRWNV
jgi:hypothetical protein